jgi:hypothetical protein
MMRKSFSMTEWENERGAWNGGIGLWAAERLVYNTECDVTNYLVVVFRFANGKRLEIRAFKTDR